jgi:hypothetical protein
MASKQGITSLRRPMSLNESYGAMQQSVAKSNPKASQAVNQALDRITPMLNKLDDKTLGLLLQLTQYLKDNKSKYKQAVAKLVEKGSLPPNVFPENYDPKFLSVFALSIARAQQGMADGGIADIAQNMKNQGRGEDTMLAHINPKEAALLRSQGGVGTLNPETGLPEFNILDDLGNGLKGVGDFLGDVLRPVGNAIGDILNSPVGMAMAGMAGMYFLGMPFGAESTIPGLGSSISGAEAVIPAAADSGIFALANDQVAALSAADIASQLTPAALESGMGTPGYGFSASAAESGLFDPAKIGAGAETGASSGISVKDIFKKGKDLLSNDSEEKPQSDPNQLLKLIAMLEMMNQNKTPAPVSALGSANTALPYDSPDKQYISNYAQKAADGGLMMTKRYDIGGLTANRTQTDYLSKMRELDKNGVPIYRPGQGGIGYFNPLEYKSLADTVKDIANSTGAPLSTAGISTLMPEFASSGGRGLKEDPNPEWTMKTDEEKAQWFGENQDSGITKFQKYLEGYWPLKNTPEYKKQVPLTQGISPLTGLSYVTPKPYLNAVTGAPMTPSSPAVRYNVNQPGLFDGMDKSYWNSLERETQAVNEVAAQAQQDAAARAEKPAVTLDGNGSIVSTDNTATSSGGGGGGYATSNTPGFGNVAAGYTGGSEAARGGLLDSRYAHGGGIAALAQGGMYNLGSYSDGGRLLRGPGDGVSDDIPATIGGKQPARLANGEFVIPARIVSELGNGSTDAGAKRLYEMMARIQKVRRKTKNVAANTKAAKYLPA